LNAPSNSCRTVSNLLYAYGDVPNPIPDTVKVVDEILTEFIEGICFESSQHATIAGRQKLKLEDFEFSLRRNPQYLGKIRTMLDKRIELKEMRKAFAEPEDDAVLKNHAKGAAGGPGGVAAPRSVKVEELLDDDDDDDPDIAEALQQPKKKKRKTGGA
jgi:transcription initiation factor TFIID subunit 13